MSFLSWRTRKSRLATLLNSQGDEDVDALALDRLLHGQSVIGKTGELFFSLGGPKMKDRLTWDVVKTKEIDALRFTDRDLQVVGTLEYGQFGVVRVVSGPQSVCV